MMIQSFSQVDAIDKPAAYRDGIVAAVMTAVASASLVETSDSAKVAVMMSGRDRRRADDDPSRFGGDIAERINANGVTK
jgi:hypothetical protein